MKSLFIKSDKNKLFKDFFKIYESSFPDYERRSLSQLIESLKAKNFHIKVYFDNDKLAALLAYWNMASYIFIEYIAVNNQLRNSGMGSKILREFLEENKSKFSILEIDIPSDEISIRRLHFYERLGFYQNDFYIAQKYMKSNQNNYMQILSFPNKISKGIFEKFDKEHSDIIMKVCK